ncbi:MAG: hypothetical protein COS99_02895 [Candidatus Omnitrophica bacterium CG07_land_8_20_14_0_80_42_15]|uniref:Methyltransferase type 11 domain-containing protein n=1 Tax=Candidatus Aquitaenariimonas noxiae TaxID=1974741 RepID=A0A2J0KTX3_9BACT|nr:MAG: hypothetical protein COS99_02895 [Candidatus Omnitrophica bacterium CG07_land_8_20_14_0_80_42_15]
MMMSKVRHNWVFKIAAMAMVCAFLFNDIAVANPNLRAIAVPTGDHKVYEEMVYAMFGRSEKSATALSEDLLQAISQEDNIGPRGNESLGRQVVDISFNIGDIYTPRGQPTWKRSDYMLEQVKLQVDAIIAEVKKEMPDFFKRRSIEAILDNAYTNAIDAVFERLDEGSIEREDANIRFRLFINDQTGAFYLILDDTGVGISGEVLKHWEGHDGSPMTTKDEHGKRRFIDFIGGVGEDAQDHMLNLEWYSDIYVFFESLRRDDSRANLFSHVKGNRNITQSGRQGIGTTMVVRGELKTASPAVPPGSPAALLRNAIARARDGFKSVAEIKPDDIAESTARDDLMTLYYAGALIRDKAGEDAKFRVSANVTQAQLLDAQKYLNSLFSQPGSVKRYRAGEGREELIAALRDIVITERARVAPRQPTQPNITYYRKGTPYFDRFKKLRSIPNTIDNLELIFSIPAIAESLRSRDRVTIFNLGSGKHPIPPFSNYDVKNFDADYAGDELPAGEIARDSGARFENKEITQIAEPCTVAIWYNLPYFIKKYASSTSIWQEPPRRTGRAIKRERTRVLKMTLQHTWDLIEDGGYFIITGRQLINWEEPNRPEDIFAMAISMDLNISEVHVIGEVPAGAQAIILRKGYSGTTATAVATARTLPPGSPPAGAPLAGPPVSTAPAAPQARSLTETIFGLKGQVVKDDEGNEYVLDVTHNPTEWPGLVVLLRKGDETMMWLALAIDEENKAIEQRLCVIRVPSFTGAGVLMKAIALVAGALPEGTVWEFCYEQTPVSGQSEHSTYAFDLALGGGGFKGRYIIGSEYSDEEFPVMGTYKEGAGLQKISRGDFRDFYDREFETCDNFIRALGIKKGDRVFDVGTGWGWFVQPGLAAAEKGASVTAIDTHKYMIKATEKKARSAYPEIYTRSKDRLRYEEGNFLSRERYPDNSWDYTFLFNLLDGVGIEKAGEITSRALDVTRNGGKIVISTIYPPETYLEIFEGCARRRGVELELLPQLSEIPLGHPFGVKAFVYRIKKPSSAPEKGAPKRMIAKAATPPAGSPAVLFKRATEIAATKFKSVAELTPEGIALSTAGIDLMTLYHARLLVREGSGANVRFKVNPAISPAHLQEAQRYLNDTFSERGSVTRYRASEGKQELITALRHLTGADFQPLSDNEVQEIGFITDVVARCHERRASGPEFADRVLWLTGATRSILSGKRMQTLSGDVIIPNAPVTYPESNMADEGLLIADLRFGPTRRDTRRYYVYQTRIPGSTEWKITVYTSDEYGDLDIIRHAERGDDGAAIARCVREKNYDVYVNDLFERAKPGMEILPMDEAEYQRAAALLGSPRVASTVDAPFHDFPDLPQDKLEAAMGTNNRHYLTPDLQALGFEGGTYISSDDSMYGGDLLGGGAGDFWDLAEPHWLLCIESMARKTGFHEILLKDRLFGSIDSSQLELRRAPRDNNLGQVASWIGMHMLDNWSRVSPGTHFLTASRRCEIMGADAMQMVFKDSGEGINIEEVFEKGPVEKLKSLRYGKHSTRQWGGFLTRALLAENRIGNIQISSRGRRVTYYFDGTKKVEASPVTSGTEINIVVFSPREAPPSPPEATIAATEPSRREAQASSLVDSIKQEVAGLEEGKRLGIVIDTGIANLGEYGPSVVEELRQVAGREEFRDKLDIITGEGSVLLGEVNQYLREDANRVVRGIIRNNSASIYNKQFNKEGFSRRIRLVAIDDLKIQNSDVNSLGYVPIIPILEFALRGGNIQGLPSVKTVEPGQGIISSIVTLDLPSAERVPEDRLRQLYNEDQSFLSNA